MAAKSGLTHAERQLVLAALAEPRGRYSATRASQLSGVPERTVYHWANTLVLTPDFGDERPKSWSYRDLVLLRLIVFLRSHKVELRFASELAARYRTEFGSDARERIETRVSSAQGGYAVGPEMAIDALTGQRAFEVMAQVSGHFDLMVALEDRSAVMEIKGPSLVRPSARTAISPWVMSGEPVVRNSRITTATIFALHERRGLGSEDIAGLYPTLTAADVDDAISMERNLVRRAA